MEQDEYLLKKNSIVFSGEDNIKSKRDLRYELSTLYEQKPNSKLFYMPREWFYLKNQEPGDTSNFKKWQTRVLGEPPTIYNDSLTRITTEAMEFYLKYKGFYDAEVEYDANEDSRGKRKLAVEYIVEAKKQYQIDSVAFFSKDTTVHQILQDIKEESFLQKGIGIDRDLYNSEKKRIYNYLKNHGFAYFYPQYIDALVGVKAPDSNTINLSLEVFTPPEGEHQIYSVGKVLIYPDFDPAAAKDQYRDTTILNHHFKLLKKELEVHAATLINAIYLKEGDVFSEELYEKTNKQLSALGIFKFVRLRQEKDSITNNLLNINIELTSNYNVELGVDVELSYTNTTLAVSSGNLIGISASPSIRNKNVFGGAELLVSNLTAGIEIDPRVRDTSRFWNTVDLGIQTDLFFPKFRDYFKIWKGLDKATRGKKLIKKYTFYDELKDNAETKISASYNYLLILDFYRYNLFNASYGFDLKRSTTHHYAINHVGIDLLAPVTQPAFDSILMANPFFERSFGRQLFVSMLFRDFNYVFNSKPDRNGKSHYVGARVEMAGAEIWLGNSIYNSFALEPDTLRIDSIDFSQYFKLELDLRYYKQFTTQSSIAARLDIGIARPFGFTSDVPYVKQFYVGGANSIRGWAARGLGPGGYLDSLALNPSENRLLFYQTGDIKLEMSLEYRFNIFWRLKGALFLDAGNVWTFREDPNRCGSQFLFNSRPCSGDGEVDINAPFYKQIALATGLGFRIDLTYFLFRFDLGLNLRNPRPTSGTVKGARERDYWTEIGKLQLRNLEPHIGLGFPF